MATIHEAHAGPVTGRWCLVALLAGVLLAAGYARACEYTIDTIVGGGTPEGINALEANIAPQGVAIRNGEVYVSTNFRLRKIALDGTIRTIAGLGNVPGIELNGGDALMADLVGDEIVIAGDGTIYVASAARYCVRRVDVDGTIHTVAGTWSVRGSPGEGEGGLATDAAFFDVRGIALGPDGSLYIATYSQIRRVLLDGTLVTIAGTTSSGPSAGDGGLAVEAVLDSPADVAVDSSGRVYIADRNDGRVRVVDLGGIIRTLAGIRGAIGDTGDGGPATAATVGQPVALWIDDDGSVLIGDIRHGKIRRVDPTGIISTVAGTGTIGYSGDGGPATSAMFGRFSLLMHRAPDGTLYVADPENNRLRAISPDGIVRTVAGNGTRSFAGDGGPAIEAAISGPTGAASLPDGSMLIADIGNYRIRRIDPAGIIDTWAGNGAREVSGDGGLALEAGVLPLDLASTAAGEVYTLEALSIVRVIDINGIIRRVAGNGTEGFSGDGGPAVNAQLDNASGIGIGPDGSIYVADTDNMRVRRVDPAGVISTVAGTGDRSSTGDGGLAINAGLNRPSDIAFDSAGNMFVSEVSGNRIRRIAADGTITTVAGTGFPGFAGDLGVATDAEINTPWGIAIAGDGSLLIADSANERVRRVDSLGLITTIAGDGGYLFNGDGQCAVEASFRNPVRLLPVGDRILVMDSFMGRVRVLEPTTEVATAFFGLEGTISSEGVLLRWESRTDRIVNYSVERSVGVTIEVIGQFTGSGAGAEEYFDSTALSVASVTYRVRVEVGGVELALLGPVTVQQELPTQVRLRAWPNPMRAGGQIEFSLPTSAQAHLDVFDSRGRRVQTLMSTITGPGTLVVPWDGTGSSGRRVANGAYYFVLRDGSRVLAMKKVLVMR